MSGSGLTLPTGTEAEARERLGRPQWLKDYYRGGKRVMRDGAPCRVPKWWNTLGNDKEAREAAKQTFNPAHYPEGTIRVVRDGIPYRFAAHVAKWKKANRDALCQGSDRFGLTLVPHSKKGWPYPDGATALETHYGDKYLRLSWQRRDMEHKLNEFSFPPDLFAWARWQRKAQRAKLRGLFS